MMINMRGLNKMTLKKLEMACECNWGQPWDCPKTQACDFTLTHK
jgi:hypothetical protein